jgi:quercetin dioxygenase-like cupin family protein
VSSGGKARWATVSAQRRSQLSADPLGSEGNRRVSRLNVRTVERVFSTDEVQVSHLVLAPGEEVPWHFHSDVRDTFYVLRGPVMIYTREPEATAVVETGEVLQTRDRQPHRVFNASDHEISFVLIQGIGKFDFRPLTPPP